MELVEFLTQQAPLDCKYKNSIYAKHAFTGYYFFYAVVGMRSIEIQLYIVLAVAALREIWTAALFL